MSLTRNHDHRAPGLWRMALALLGAALVAWALVMAGLLAETGAMLLAGAMLGRDPILPSADIVLPMVAMLALIGLPVVAAICLGLGLPFWLWARRRGPTSRRAAAWAGAGAGLLVGLVLLGLSVHDGLRIAREPVSFNAYRLGVQTISGGMPTPAGWALWIMNLALLAAVGLAAGLAARRLAGLRGRA